MRAWRASDHAADDNSRTPDAPWVQMPLRIGGSLHTPWASCQARGSRRRDRSRNPRGQSSTRSAQSLRDNGRTSANHRRATGRARCGIARRQRGRCRPRNAHGRRGRCRRSTRCSAACHREACGTSGKPRPRAARSCGMTNTRPRPRHQGARRYERDGNQHTPSWRSLGGQSALDDNWHKRAAYRCAARGR